MYTYYAYEGIGSTIKTDFVLRIRITCCNAKQVHFTRDKRFGSPCSPLAITHLYLYYNIILHATHLFCIVFIIITLRMNGCNNKIFTHLYCIKYCAHIHITDSPLLLIVEHIHRQTCETPIRINTL